MNENCSLVYKIKARGRTFSVSVDGGFTRNPPKSSAEELHYHAEYELFFCDDRELILKTQEGEKHFSRCAVVVPPSFEHTSLREGFGYVVRLSVLEGEGFASDETTVLPLTDEAAFYLSGIERALSSPFYAEKLPHLLTLLFWELTQEGEGYRVGRLPRENYAQIVESFLFERYAERVSLKELAEELGVSLKQASRIVKKKFGTTFPALLKKERMRRAKELLRSSKSPISEISRLCGYENENYFFSSFKESYGTTPAKFRLQKGEKEENKS